MKTESFEIERPKYSNPTVARIWSLVEFYQKSLKEAAEALGLSYGYVRKLASQNHIHIRDRNRAKKVTSRNVTLCNECGGPIRSVDGELVCQSCGLTTPIMNLSQRLPYDTTYAHMSNMSFGKSLGSEIGGGRRGLFQVLAKAPNGQKDLGLRSRQIRVFQTNLEPRQTMCLLSEGSEILKQLGLYNVTENYDPRSHQLGEAYGNVLRKVGAWLAISKTKPRSYARLASAALYTTLDDFQSLAENLIQQPEKATILYDWKAEDLKLVSDILSIGKTEKRGK